MKQRHLAIFLALASLATGELAVADLTGVRATPRQASLSGTGPGTVSIRWHVATTADHSTGVVSAGGVIVDTSSGETLLAVRGRLGGDGMGPYSFRDTLRLDPETVRLWMARGLSRVVFRRSFADPVGNVLEGSVLLRLNRSGLTASREAAPAALVVSSLRVEFESGNNTEVAGLHSKLEAQLTVTYTGTGVLRGRWQIAEPESADGVPLYRTLALVNRNLTGRQRATLASPRLPTDRPGKYLLRFCLIAARATPPGADPQCPDGDSLVTAIYQVRSEPVPERILDIAPDRQPVGASTTFSWRPIAEARLYQLQIFAVGASDAGVPGSRVTGANVEPHFVTGMMLDAGNRQTPLSDLVLSRLEPGQRYLWRINAYDERGRLVGRSDEADFLYQPAD